MSISNSTIKEISKNILRGNTVSNMVICVALISSFFVCSNISSVLSLVLGEIAAVVVLICLFYLILMPLCLGAFRYFWRLCCGVRDNPILLFFYFSSKKDYAKALKFTLHLFARIVFTYLIFSVPVFLARIISGTWLYTALDVSIPIWTVNFSHVTGFLNTLAVIATVFASLKFYLAPMLFVADESLDVSETLHLSNVISKRTYWDYLFLVFSLIGWIALSVFVIPMIFTLPYIITAYLVHASYAVSAFNEKISKINQDDIPTYIAGV